MSEVTSSEPTIVSKPDSKPNKKMTPEQRQRAASIRTIEERMRAKEAAGAELNPAEQRTKALLDLHTKLETEPEKIDINNLTLQEKMALLNGIGFSVGEQLFAGVTRASRVAGQTAKEAIPLTVPITLAGSGLTHELALRFPEVTATIAASDEAAVIVAALGYLGFKSLKGLLTEGKMLAPLINELKMRYKSAMETPTRSGVKATMFAAACAGAIFALEDPEGAGTTITPVLGGIATLEFTHRLTEKLTENIGEEVANRLAKDQAVDINDPTFLISMGLTEVKDITRNLIRKVRDAKSVDKLIKRLTRQGSEGEVLPRGAIEQIVEDVLFNDDDPKSGHDAARGGPTTTRPVKYTKHSD